MSKIDEIIYTSTPALIVLFIHMTLPPSLTTPTHSGLCSNDYYDEVCRQNTSLVYHDPPLLYNLHSDPGELYPLDSYTYRRVLESIEMVSTVQS